MLALPTVSNFCMAFPAYHHCHAELFLLACDAIDAIVGLAPDAGNRIMHSIVGLAPDAGKSMSQNRQIWQNM